MQYMYKLYQWNPRVKSAIHSSWGLLSNDDDSKENSGDSIQMTCLRIRCSYQYSGMPCPRVLYSNKRGLLISDDQE
jgi:hypothetical protein